MKQKGILQELLSVVAMNSVLKGFLHKNFEKLWCTLDDNLNQFSQSIITFGEHKAVNVHL